MTEAPTHHAAPLPVWDPLVIQHLVGANEALQKRLLARFLETGAQTLANMVIAANAADWGTLSRLAHSLKSAGRSVGALELGDGCQELERAGKELDATRCPQLLSSVTGMFEQVRELMNAH